MSVRFRISVRFRVGAMVGDRVRSYSHPHPTYINNNIVVKFASGLGLKCLVDKLPHPDSFQNRRQKERNEMDERPAQSEAISKAEI